MLCVQIVVTRKKFPTKVMKEEVTMKTKVLMLVTAMLVSTSMGMRLEPEGKYTGVTLVISDDVPDHDCEEMLARLKVYSTKQKYIQN